MFITCSFYNYAIVYDYIQSYQVDVLREYSHFLLKCHVLTLSNRLSDNLL
jgi:hypothetical protein